jgi:hypothetical protein
MAGEKAKMKLLTVQEANALLPQVRLSLRSLRALKSIILRGQAQIEIEEMTGSNGQGNLDFSAQAAINHQMDILQTQTLEFERELEKLFAMGAQLKDLDSGLVDFYSRRGSDIVFLCWKEGESEIAHWHGLEGGFRSRESL